MGRIRTGKGQQVFRIIALYVTTGEHNKQLKGSSLRDGQDLLMLIGDSFYSWISLNCSVAT
jgi:hypothetical protein